MYVFLKHKSLVSPAFELHNSKHWCSTYYMPGSQLTTCQIHTGAECERWEFNLVWLQDPCSSQRCQATHQTLGSLVRICPTVNGSSLDPYLRGVSRHSAGAQRLADTWTCDDRRRGADPLARRCCVVLAKHPLDSRKSLCLVPATHRYHHLITLMTMLSTLSCSLDYNF